MNTNKFILGSLIACVAFLLFAATSHALFNPAPKYCKQMGLESRIKNTPNGQTGLCRMPDNTECDDWAFYSARCGLKYGYCAKKGLNTKLGKGQECASSYYGECAVCVFSDGKEMPMIELMRQNGEPLSVEEKSFRQTGGAAICGDQICQQGEDINNCAVDCQPKVATGEKKTSINGGLVAAIVGFIVLLGGLIFFVYRKFLAA